MVLDNEVFVYLSTNVFIPFSKMYFDILTFPNLRMFGKGSMVLDNELFVLHGPIPPGRKPPSIKMDPKGEK